MFNAFGVSLLHLVSRFRSISRWEISFRFSKVQLIALSRNDKCRIKTLLNAFEYT